MGRLGCCWRGSDEVATDFANGVPTFALVVVTALSAASVGGFALGQVEGCLTVGGAKGVAAVEDKEVRAFAAAHNHESRSSAFRPAWLQMRGPPLAEVALVSWWPGAASDRPCPPSEAALAESEGLRASVICWGTEAKSKKNGCDN